MALGLTHVLINLRLWAHHAILGHHPRMWMFSRKTQLEYCPVCGGWKSTATPAWGPHG